MLYLAGISISFFLSLVLFSKRGCNLADKILASWLMLMGIHLLFFYFGITGLIFEHPWLLGIHLPLPLLHGPFLYLYAAAQTGRLKKWDVSAFLHFLPVAVNYFYLVHFFISPAEYKIHVYRNRGGGYELYMLLNSNAIMLSGVLYIIATSLLLRRHRRQILHEFSATEKVNLWWLTYLMYGISLIWLLVFIGNDNLIFGAAVLFVVFIGYSGMQQVGIFTTRAGVDEFEDAVPAISEIATTEEISFEESPGPEKKKYARSGLTDAMAVEIHDRLAQVMQEEKLFVQSELTLSELAAKMGVHPNHLSQVMNERVGQTFYDYIHTLRVEDFKSRLLHSDLQKYTLLSLAFESGFNSKSTFNKYFRKVTGISPSEYLAQVTNNKTGQPIAKQQPADIQLP